MCTALDCPGDRGDPRAGPRLRGVWRPHDVLRPSDGAGAVRSGVPRLPVVRPDHRPQPVLARRGILQRHLRRRLRPAAPQQAAEHGHVAGHPQRAPEGRPVPRLGRRLRRARPDDARQGLRLPHVRPVREEPAGSRLRRRRAGVVRPRDGVRGDGAPRRPGGGAHEGGRRQRPAVLHHDAARPRRAAAAGGLVVLHARVRSAHRVPHQGVSAARRRPARLPTHHERRELSLVPSGPSAPLHQGRALGGARSATGRGEVAGAPRRADLSRARSAWRREVRPPGPGSP